MWPLTGEHHHRPRLLQADPDLRESEVVGEYQRGGDSGKLASARIYDDADPPLALGE